jgi:hypothetical protein
MNNKITGTCWDINVHFSINGWSSRLCSAPPIFGRFYLPFPIIQAPSGQDDAAQGSKGPSAD